MTLIVSVDGIEHKMDTLARNAEDLNKPLKQFGGYLRTKAKARYAAQNFAPLAESTIEKRTRRGLDVVEGRLKSALRKAVESPKVRVKTRERKAALLAEFQQRHGRASAIGPMVPLSLKQLIGLGTKEDKAVAKAVSAPILGKLPQSLKVMVARGTVTLASRTKGNWSAVHNEGDGHVPQRETIKLESEDIDVLWDILREHLLLGVAED